jgi:phage shock protein C
MRCFYHEDKDAVGICISCKKGVCPNCAIEYNNKLYCPSCFSSSNKRTGKRVIRDIKKAYLGGVCAGIANYFEIDPIIMRIIWLICCFTPLSAVAIFLYLFLWLFLPKE